MVRRPRSAAGDLRAFIAAAVAQGMPRVEDMRAPLAVRELVQERAAPPPPGIAANVCWWVRTATQLAVAAADNAVAEPKWKDVLAAVEGWTDGGRHEPGTPFLAHGNDALQAADGRAPALGGR